MANIDKTKLLFEGWRSFLVKEDQKQRIVSFDFDNTLTAKYSDKFGTRSAIEIGPNPEMISRLKRHKALGDIVYIVTARKKDTIRVKDVKEFVKHHNLPIDGIYFTSYQPKIHTLLKLGAERHYDDKEREIQDIQKFGLNKVKGVLVK